MTPESATKPDIQSNCLFAQNSGFVSSGTGVAPADDGVIAVLLSAVFGGFCGLLGGFILAQISHYVGYLTGRRLWGARWVLIGIVAGALLFGIKAWMG
jgi:hypothetical protein